MTDERAIRLSVVLAVEPPALGLAQTVARLDEAIGRVGDNRDYEVLVAVDADDGAISDAVAALERPARDARVVKPELPGKAGLGALLALRESRGEIVVCLYPDAAAPEDVAGILEGFADSDAELVVGRRAHPRRGRLAGFATGLFTGVRDPFSGVFGVRRAVLDKCDVLDPVGTMMPLELIVKCRCAHVRETRLGVRDVPATGRWGADDWVLFVKHLKRLSDFKYRGFSHFAQFCLVGALGMVVDLFCYYVFLEIGKRMEIGRGMLLATSRVLAIYIAMSFNFVINRRLTFSHTRKTKIWGQYRRFVASCSVGGLVSWSVAVGLAEWGGFFTRHWLSAALVGILTGLFFNYTLSCYWVFQRPSDPASPPD